MQLARWGLFAWLVVLSTHALAQTTQPGQIAARYRVTNLSSGLPAFGNPDITPASLNASGRAVTTEWTSSAQTHLRVSVFDNGELSWRAEVPGGRGVFGVNASGQILLRTYVAPYIGATLLSADGASAVALSVPEYGPSNISPVAFADDGTVLFSASGSAGAGQFLWSAAAGLRSAPLYSAEANFGTVYASMSPSGRFLTGTSFLVNGPMRAFRLDTSTGNFAVVAPGETRANGTLVNDVGAVVLTDFASGRYVRCLSDVCTNATLASTGTTALRGLRSTGDALFGGVPSGNGAVFWAAGGTEYPLPSDYYSAFAFKAQYAFNDYAMVVGQKSLQGAEAAWVWTPAAGEVDLNARLASSVASMLSVTRALSINNRGQILAYDSSFNPVLLTPDDGPLPAPPTVGQLTGPDLVAVNTSVSLRAPFVDVNTSDTHVAQWAWGDGATSAATVTESAGSGAATGSHVYTAAGVYSVNATVTDNSGRSGTSSSKVVVYDPSAGFVTGSGWLLSPPGAMPSNPSAVGRADFDFVSKYKKGATVPSGDTSFIFATAQLQFASTSYDWLVVAGTKAQYKGAGTLNGVAGYKFMLTALDGAKKAAADRLRLRIWHYDPTTQADVVDYDNQVDASLEGTAQEGTDIRGGNIMVH